MLRSRSPNKLVYPDVERLIQLASDPAVRALLPDGIRPADADADAAQITSHLLLRGRLAPLVNGLMTALFSVAGALGGLGVVALILAGFRSRRPEDKSAAENGGR